MSRIFKKRATSKEEYAEEMRRHLDEIAFLKSSDTDAPVTQNWVFEHKDGRVAHLQDRCPYQELYERSKADNEHFFRELENKTNYDLMRKKQKFNGIVVFDGKITVTIDRKQYHLHTDFYCTELRNADKYREVVIISNKYVPYGEIITGFVENYDDTSFKLIQCIGENEIVGATIHYSEVVAWGYVDEADKFVKKKQTIKKQ